MKRINVYLWDLKHLTDQSENILPWTFIAAEVKGSIGTKMNDFL